MNQFIASHEHNDNHSSYASSEEEGSSFYQDNFFHNKDVADSHEINHILHKMKQETNTMNLKNIFFIIRNLSLLPVLLSYPWVGYVRNIFIFFVVGVIESTFFIFYSSRLKVAFLRQSQGLQETPGQPENQQFVITVRNNRHHDNRLLNRDALKEQIIREDENLKYFHYIILFISCIIWVWGLAVFIFSFNSQDEIQLIPQIALVYYLVTQFFYVFVLMLMVTLIIGLLPLFGIFLYCSEKIKKKMFQQQIEFIKNLTPVEINTVQNICLSQSCILCQEEFNFQAINPDQQVCMFECKHAFHHTCIQKWLLQQLDCPTCKQLLIQ